MEIGKPRYSIDDDLSTTLVREGFRDIVEHEGLQLIGSRCLPVQAGGVP